MEGVTSRIWAPRDICRGSGDCFGKFNTALRRGSFSVSYIFHLEKSASPPNLT